MPNRITGFKLFIFFCFALLSSGTNAQFCATPVTQSDIQFESAFQIKRQQAQSQSFVPVKLKLSVYIFKYNNSINAASITAVKQAIDSANAAFRSIDISFEACTFTFISDNDLFNFSNDEEPDLFAAGHTDSTINLYVTGTVNIISPPSQVCGYTYLPASNFNDMIVMGGSCLTGGTLIHELGHFFDLYHTHETIFGNELVNGSNCTIAGDLLCDTQADPLLGSNNVNNACVYTGTQTDVNGDAYTPDPGNIMSYAPPTCRDYFSGDQLSRMRFAYDNYKDYLINYGFGYVQTDTLICPGMPVTIGLTGTATNILWNTSDTTSTITVIPGASISYILNFNADGCSFNKVFVIYTTPQFIFNSASSSTTCAGTSRVVYVMGTDTNYTYQLLLNGVASGLPLQGNGATVNFSTGPLNITSVAQIQVYSTQLACSYLLNTSHTLNVHPIPSQNVTFVAANDSICSGGAMSFYIYPTQPAFRYGIYNGTASTSLVFGNNDTLFFNVPVGAAGIDTFYAEVANTCSTYVTSQSIIINSIAHPQVVTATLVEDSVCKGDPAYFSIINSELGVNYLVSNFGNLVSTPGTGGNILAPTIPITVGTSFSVSAYNAFGCGTSLVFSANVYLEQPFTDAGLVFPYSSTTKTATIVAGDSVACFNMASNAVSHLWTINTDSNTFVTDTARNPDARFYYSPGVFPVYYHGLTVHGCSSYDTLIVNVLPESPASNGSFCYLTDTCSVNPYPYTIHQDACGNTITGGYEWVFSYKKVPWLMKTDPNGNILWFKNTSVTFAFGDGAAIFGTITTDSAGYIYAGGSFGAEQMFIDGVAAGINASVAAPRPFLVKYDENGNRIWHIVGEHVGTTSTVFGGFTSVQMGPNGNLYLAFHSTYWMNIHFTDTIISTGSPSVYNPYLVFEMDTAGNFISMIAMRSRMSSPYTTNPTVRFMDPNYMWTRELFAQSPSINFRKDGTLVFSGAHYAQYNDTLFFDATHQIILHDTMTVYFYATYDKLLGWQHLEEVANLHFRGTQDARVQLDKRDNLYFGVIPLPFQSSLSILQPQNVNWMLGSDTIHKLFRAALVRYDATHNFLWKRVSPNAFWEYQTVAKDGTTSMLLGANNKAFSFEIENSDSVYFSDPYGGSVILSFNDNGSLKDFRLLHDRSDSHHVVAADENRDLVICEPSEIFTMPGQVPNNCTYRRLIQFRYSLSSVCGIPGCIDSLSIEPDLPITSVVPAIVCAGDSIFVAFDVQDIAIQPANVFYLELISANGSAAIIWIDSLVSTTTGTFACLLPSTLVTGNYYLRVASTLPAFTGNYFAQPITIHSKPQPLITAAGPLLLAGTYISYQWYFNNTIISGATDSTLMAASTGIYMVEVTDAFGCTGMDTIYFSNVGVNELAENGFVCWPNPVTDKLFYAGLVPGKNEFEIKLYDATGRIILHQFSSPSNNSIDLSFIQSGIYFVEIGGMKTKIIKL